MSDTNRVDMGDIPSYTNGYSQSELSYSDDFSWLSTTDIRQDDTVDKTKTYDSTGTATYDHNREATKAYHVEPTTRLNSYADASQNNETLVDQKQMDVRPKLESIQAPDNRTNSINKPLPPISPNMKFSNQTVVSQGKKNDEPMPRDSLGRMSDNMLRSLQKYRMNVGNLLTNRPANDVMTDHYHTHNDVHPTPHAYEFGPPPPKEESYWSSKHSVYLQDRQHSFPRFSRFSETAETAASLPLVSNSVNQNMKESITPSVPLKPILRSHVRKCDKSTQATPVKDLHLISVRDLSKMSEVSTPQSSIMGTVINLEAPRNRVIKRAHFRKKSSILNSSVSSAISMSRRSSAAQFTLNVHQRKGSSRAELRQAVSSIFDEEEEHNEAGVSFIREAIGEEEHSEENDDEKSANVLQKAKTVARVNKRANLGCFRLLLRDLMNWWKMLKSREEELPFFNKQLRIIQGHFGSGILAFFVFLRWIFMLNLILAVIWSIFIVFPQMLFFDYSKASTKFYAINMVTGGGPLQDSWMFYGSYEEMIKKYPLAFMYLICIILTSFGGFFLILRSLAVAIEGEGILIWNKKYKLLTFLFTSWDYLLQSSEAAKNLNMGIANTFKEIIYDIEVLQVLDSQSKKEKRTNFIRRASVWIFTFLLLGAGCTVIFVVLSSDIREWTKKMGYDASEDSIAVTYTPTIVYFLIDCIVPEIVYWLPKFEYYSRKQREIHITTARVLILRTVIIMAMMISLQQKVRKGNFTGCAGTVLGQELYKIVVIDTTVGIGTVLIPNFAKYWWYREKQEFDMPPQVLKILKRQALIWVGTIVCPIMPWIGLISTTIFFFTNYIMVMYTCKPPEKRWNQPRRSSFFVGLTVVPIVIVIIAVSVILAGNDHVFLGDNNESTSDFCGPFTNNTVTSVYRVWKDQVRMTNPDFGSFLEFITSGTVYTPLLFIMIAVVYYQKLRINWEKKRSAVAFAELQQEREMLRSLNQREERNF